LKFHLTHSFPVAASRLWQVAVEEYGDSEMWDRSVHSGRPVPDAKPVDGIDQSAFLFDTSFGQLTVQFLDVRRDGEGGVMAYTISDGLPSVVTGGRSTWTIRSVGPDESMLTIDVALTTNAIGTIVSPLLKMIFRRGDKQIISDLHSFLVTGTPSAAKQKATAKRADK
jgi:hypothetical protein